MGRAGDAADANLAGARDADMSAGLAGPAACGPDGGKRFRLLLLSIVVLGVGLRIGYVLSVGRHVTLGLDAIGYELLGKGLAHGRGYSNPVVFFTHGVERPTANFPPGYPLLLAGVDKLGITSTTGMELVGACIGAVTVAATGFLGRRVSGRSMVGLIAALLVAVSPSLVASAGSPMSEALSVPMMLVLLLAACWAAESSSWVPWSVVGGLAGLLALVRSEDIVVALLLVPAAIATAPRLAWRGRAVRVSLALVATAAVMSPWLVRNLTTFHPPVLVSTAADKTLAGANCHATYYGTLLGYWDYSCLGHDQLADSDEARYGKVLSDEGTDYFAHHLSRAPLVLTVRVLRSWELYDPAQGAHLAGAETRSVGWQQVAWPVSLLVLILAVPGIVDLRRYRFALVLLAGPAVVDTLIVLTTYGNDRFVLSAIPSLCIGAAATSVRIGNRVARRIHSSEEERSGAREEGSDRPADGRRDDRSGSTIVSAPPILPTVANPNRS
jgi:Dolichyl-phosphate-mannose-protein mannosyltransferase